MLIVKCLVSDLIPLAKILQEFAYLYDVVDAASDGLYLLNKASFR